MRKRVLLGFLLGIFHNLAFLGLASGFNISTGGLTVAGVEALRMMLAPSTVLFTVFLIPLKEEVIFRLPVVAVFRFSQNEFLRTLVFTFQAVVFAAGHLSKGPAAALSAVTFGVLGGLMAAKTRSLYPSIYYHVAQNLTAVAVVVLALFLA